MESKTRVVLAMLVASLPGIARSASAQEYVPGEVLVVFKAGVQRAVVDQVMTANAVRVIEHFEHAGVYHATVAAGKTVPETVALLEQNANVEGASPNYIYQASEHLTEPIDPGFDDQWGLNNTGQVILGQDGVIDADIDAPQAWDHLTDCSGEVVAIMDTGIDFGHPDFAGNDWVNPGEIPGNGIDDDGNGFVDDVNGADLISRIRHGHEIGTNGVYDPGECIYNDQDSSNSVTEFDTRLTGCAGFAAGTIVAPGDGDAGNLLVPFISGAPLFERHNDADGNGIYSVGDAVYIDRDGSGTVTVADTRCMTVGVLLVGPVVAGDADIGTALIEIHARSGDVTDLQGHGTNVASVVGARGNNPIDITGVCWEVKLMGLRVGHPIRIGADILAQATLANVIGAVNYVIGVKMRPVAPVNVRIINYSYWRDGAAGVPPAPSPAELQTLNSAGVAGILFVTIAGNHAIDVDGAFGPSYPCNYVPAPVDNVICVGASDNRDRLADFSNWGTTSVDLNAPGLDILMLRRTEDGGGTEYASGTSFAAPHVAGIAAHFWSLPGFEAHTIDELKDRLLTGLNGPIGVPHPHGVDPRFGGQFAPGPSGPAVGSVVSGINHDGRARMVMGDDFGDAPDLPYPTVLDPVGDGARHEDIGEEWLGRDPDCPYGEPQPPGFSDVSPEFEAYDDFVGPQDWPDDPDGVQNLVDHDHHDDGIDLVGPFVFGGAPATVIVYIDTENNLVVDGDGGRYGPGGHAGTCGVHDPLDDKYVWVNGFFDWNNDGDWDDFAEHVFTLEADPSLWPTSGGVYEITFTMPPAPDERYSDQLWARFRLDYGENLGQPLIPPIFPVGPSPGGWVDYWDVPGIPWVPGAYAPNRYESVFVGGPPDLDLTYGVAQFGEVEDYYLESDYFPVSEATIDINTPLGSDTVTLIGPTTVLVDIAGLADVDTDGLEEVTTEIVQLELTGTSALFGPVTVRLRPHTSAPSERSTGLIEELSNDTLGVLDLPPFTTDGAAFSFFDVYFEIEVGGEIYHNNDPKHMETVITYKPPAEGEMYEAPEVIWLFDEYGEPTGVSIGAGSHTPDPFPPPPPVPIVSAESCMVHDDPCGEMCLPIDCAGAGAPYDNVEPRLQLGIPPVLKIHCDGPVGPGTAGCSVSCVPNAYDGTATVVSDGSADAEVQFSDTLPDQSCCTFTFTGGIQDIWTIVMLEADVNRDGQVSTADASSVKARLEMSVQDVGAQYDVNRDCMMSTADRSSVKARLENVAPVPCLCEAEPMYGACCDPYTGDCVDDVEAMDCLPPLEFYWEMQCAELEPLCGNPGACCDDLSSQGLCEDGILDALCDGTRFAGGALCADFAPVCGEYEPCEHSITMWDEYGDGWNGCTIDVYVNGEEVLSGVTIPSGAGPDYAYFQAGTGDEIFVDFICVSWCTEPSYCVYDGEGAELGCTVGGPGEGDGDLTVTGNCDFIPLTMSLPAPPPEFIPPGVPTDIDVEVFAGHDTIVDGSALLHYRYDGGGWQTSPLVQVAGELWRGTLPAPSCDDTPEFYFSVEGSVTGVVYDPPTGPSNPYIAFVGVYEAILVDNFETDQGWTVENDPSLTGGAWERAVPSTDGSWDEPTEDSDGSGHCYVTENAHHADVDWGPTMLISPTFDLSGKTDPVIRFAYWWANDDQDGDPMDIEISNDDGATWVPVLTIADVPAQWFQQEIYIATAIDPEPLTSQMKIRISVMDNPNNSQDEGGVDAVELFDVECE